MICSLCPRACRAERNETDGSGFCAMPSTARIAAARAHMWEEPCISGKNGSGTIFFSGCPLGCVFCQNSVISHDKLGADKTPEQLAEIMRSLEESGVHNISFVTGTHFTHQIIKALKIYRPSVPIVWNSGGYESEETIDALSGYVDIWLPDFKFAFSNIAEKYAGAPDYPEVVKRALLLMRKYAPEDKFDGDVMTAGVIVRHLVLPLNTKNSAAVLEWLAENMPGTLVSIMAQYFPAGRASEFPELSRKITRREYEKVLDCAERLGIEGFAQELSSAKEEYVPQFSDKV